MKVRQDVSLKKVGGQYLFVDREGRDSVVYTMNATAAYLWDKAKDTDFQRDDLVNWLVERYDVDTAVAIADIEMLLNEWQNLGLIL